MPKRIEYIDVAKGIGILLVVLGHNDLGAISPLLRQVIYSFHMPLFFFLSGYFINTSISFFDYSKKRFHSVLKPYLFTIFLVYLAAVSFENMGFQAALLRIVKSLYASANYIGWGQLWFLPALFVVSLYAYIFIKATSRWQSRWITWGLLLITLVISVPFFRVFNPFFISVLGKEYRVTGLPFNLDLVFLSGFFFILGNEVRRSTSEKTFENIYLLIGTGLGLVFLNYYFPYSVDLAKRIYDSLPINTVEAICGIFFILALSRQIELHARRLAAMLKYLGSISLIILVFHLVIQSSWTEKTMALVNHFPVAFLVGFVMGVLGPILIYEVFIRFNPVASFWFGRTAEASQPKEAPREQETAIVAAQELPAMEAKEP